jgi:hypothetical protein
MAVSLYVPVIARPDPAIHLFRYKTDARIKSAHDEEV